MPSKFGTHLWQLFCKDLKPDDYYIKLLEDALLSTLPRISSCQESIDAFILNESLTNFNWLSIHARKELIKGIASFLRNQENLSMVILENAFLNILDGLKLLFVFGFCCGGTIEYLNICHYYKPGYNPIRVPGNELSIVDPFTFTEEDCAPLLNEELEILWKDFVDRGIDSNIVNIEISSLNKICLNLFTDLTSLHIQYSYLCTGQGKALCQIGSVMNGKLKELYLLCTPTDLPKNINQVVSEEAWTIALQTCPKLRVFCVMNNVPHYDDIKTVVSPLMPLEGFYMDSSFSDLAVKETKCWYFGCTIKMLISYFHDKLRILSLHIWYSNQKVDVTIAKCITNLCYLEEFEYRGPFDKLDTVEELCQFITSNPLRIKLFHAYVLEDPCHPEEYGKAINNVYETYKGKFVAKDINFLLETTCI